MSEDTKPVANESLRNAVAAKLAEVGKETVRAAVVQRLVEDELANRTATVLDGMNRLSKLKQDLKKLKPDQKSLNENGEVVFEAYSPTKFEEKKKLNEQITKMEKALELALDKEDYSKLKDKGNEAKQNAE